MAEAGAIAAHSSHPSPHLLDILIDRADRNALKPYDDDRTWILIRDRDLCLGKTATAASIETRTQFREWVREGKVEIYQSLAEISGNDFYVIYFEDAYFLKPTGERKRVVQHEPYLDFEDM